MAELPGRLTLEQKFSLAKIEKEVQSMGLEDARAMVLELIKQSYQKNNLVKHLLKNA